MANDKTPFAGLNILNAGSYYNWTDRNADNIIIDENLKELNNRDEIPPPPVVGFKATVNGDNIDITWQNPDDTDFVGVRIVRNVNAYPTSEADGDVIYDGVGQAVTDAGVPKGQYIYYRAFTYDFDDNVQTDGSQVARGIAKGDQTAPGAPTVSSKTFDSVTLAVVAGYEYSLGGSVWQAIATFTGLEANTSYAFYQRKKETELLKASPASPVLTVTTNAPPYDDPFEAPGPKYLVAGDLTQGYFGEVSTTELISGADLASRIGLTAGTVQNDAEPWVKSAIDGKVIFWAKKTYRHTVSWDHISAAGAVYGDKIITIRDHQYKVRLFMGGNSDPSEREGADVFGSEWNRVVLPTHTQAKDGSWAYPDNVGPSDVPKDWGINYTDADLRAHNTSGDGSHTWMQETHTGFPISRLLRGSAGVSYANADTSSIPSANRGWRPVLEVVS